MNGVYPAAGVTKAMTDARISTTPQAGSRRDLQLSPLPLMREQDVGHGGTVAPEGAHLLRPTREVNRVPVPDGPRYGARDARFTGSARKQPLDPKNDGAATHSPAAAPAVLSIRMVEPEMLSEVGDERLEAEFEIGLRRGTSVAA